MSKIAWTEKTWNPIVGCSKVSPGCMNCYAEGMAVRLSNIAQPSTTQYRGVIEGGFERPAKWNGKTVFVPDQLEKPLKRKKPATYFVCSMSDLFHENTPTEWIDQVFAVMALCPQHTFQVLTKRADRMHEYFTEDWRSAAVGHVVERMSDVDPESIAWPLPNVWLGVTAENQEEADKRIPVLLDTPAAVRFVSVEPMLGPVFMPEDATACEHCGRDYESYTVFDGRHSEEYCKQCMEEDPEAASTVVSYRLGEDRKYIDWVICGCESGPNRRPMDMRWAVDLSYQCAAADVPFFMKQMESGGKVVKERSQFPGILRVQDYPKGGAE